MPFSQTVTTASVNTDIYIENNNEEICAGGRVYVEDVYISNWKEKKSKIKNSVSV